MTPERSTPLAALVSDWRPAIERAIRAKCARWGVKGADAEDLGSELWLSILINDGRVLRRFEGRSTRDTYLFRVFERAASKWIRARSRSRRTEVQGGDLYVTGGLNLVAIRRNAVEGSSASSEWSVTLQALVRALPAKDVDLLWLWAEGYSFREIASLRGQSSKAVQHRLYRALEILRKRSWGSSAQAPH